MISTRRHFPNRPDARRLFCVLGVLAVAGVSWVAPAGAVVTAVSVGPGTVTVGLQPRAATSVLDAAASASTFNNPAGNPVVHASDVYAIYWDPTDHYDGDWQALIDSFLSNVSASSGSQDNLFSVDAQYVDKTNLRASYDSTFRGAFPDTNPYPAAAGCTDPNPPQPGDAITCLSDQQIQQELQSVIFQHGLQKGMNTIYYLLTPPGVTVCLDGGGMAGHCSDSEPAPSASYSHSFCSYHSDISPTNPTLGDGNTVLYGVIPWTAGGRGDGHLALADQTPASDCQDGGFDPSSKPIEKKEKAREITVKEQEENEKKTPEEQAEILKRQALEAPHSQEPNQVEIPYDGFFDNGLADLIINQIAVEQQNIVTDPLLNAWQDSVRNEATDECRNFFAPVLGGAVTANENSFAGSLFNQTVNGGNYYLNMAFNLAALRLPYPGVPCIPGVRLIPAFTTPQRITAGDLAAFNGMESDVSLNAAVAFTPAGAPVSNYATYTWDFGDGTPPIHGYAPGGPSVNSPGSEPCATPWLSPCAAGVFHAYRYGGTYEVTLTVTDVGGYTASVSHPVTVAGPLPPGQEVPAGAPGSTTTPGGSTTTPGGATSTPGASTTLVPAPIVAATASSTSLAATLRKGLQIRYSVNEQVAGHFEVLLPTTLARRLGIRGSNAQALPAGTPPSLVIAHAILVTTGAGHNTVHIKFSKATAKRLKRLKKVTLTLRLIVHDASKQNPQTTTEMTTIVLHR